MDDAFWWQEGKRTIIKRQWRMCGNRSFGIVHRNTLKSPRRFGGRGVCACRNVSWRILAWRAGGDLWIDGGIWMKRNVLILIYEKRNYCYLSQRTDKRTCMNKRMTDTVLPPHHGSSGSTMFGLALKRARHWMWMRAYVIMRCRKEV